MTRALTLAAIVQAVGGELHAGGQRANIPAPGHSPADRSVSLLLSNGRVVICCFAGDDWRAVRAELVARGLVDRDARLPGSGGGPTGNLSAWPGRGERIRAARRLWAEARSPIGTPSARYAARRGLQTALPEDLRHHPGAPAAVYADRGLRRPALLAAIRAAAGEVVGVELTYLTAGGDRARLPLARKTIGVCPPGAAVRLGRPGRDLLVGEGVFTSLSAAAVFGWPAWALLSTRNLRRWSPPAGVRRVLVAADRGADGEQSARILAARLRGLGVVCAVRWPPAPHADWNDWLRALPEEERGPGGVGVADGWSGRAPGDPPDEP